MHEHQRALCDPWFDYEKISKMTGWSVDFAKTQIGKFPDSEIQYLEIVGGYDQQSIMQYNFPKDEFIDIPGKKNPCYREQPIDNLSAKDIAGIQVLYGAPVSSGAGARAQGEADTIPASVPDSAVAAARASLGKLDTMMQAEAAGRSGKDPKGEGRRRRLRRGRRRAEGLRERGSAALRRAASGSLSQNAAVGHEGSTKDELPGAYNTNLMPG